MPKNTELGSYNYSPLRYPGGKSRLSPFVALLIDKEHLNHPVYIEPFAGGAGIALALLMNDKVEDIVINDYDKAIYSIWRAILTEPKEFLRRIHETPITVDEWRRQKRIYTATQGRYSVDLAFSTFFLNRTNRSGIISNAGPIGGYQQSGDYLIDVRFNREDLQEKVNLIAKKKKHIHVYNHDVRRFLQHYLPRYANQCFVYFDPPYYEKGDHLYKNSLDDRDHREIHDSIVALNCPWMVTYDNATQISQIYNGCSVKKYDLTYSLSNSGVKSELMYLYSATAWPTDQELADNQIKISFH